MVNPSYTHIPLRTYNLHSAQYELGEPEEQIVPEIQVCGGDAIPNAGPLGLRHNSEWSSKNLPSSSPFHLYSIVTSPICGGGFCLEC